MLSRQVGLGDLGARRGGSEEQSMGEQLTSSGHSRAFCKGSLEDEAGAAPEHGTKGLW